MVRHRGRKPHGFSSRKGAEAEKSRPTFQWLLDWKGSPRMEPPPRGFLPIRALFLSMWLQTASTALRPSSPF